MAIGDNQGCVTRKVIKQRCAPKEVEPGKHVFRCEKITQTLRDCVGRPTEVIESETEITEQEMDDPNHGLHLSVESSSNSSLNWDKDDFKEEINNAIEGVERMTEEFMAGFDSMSGGIMEGFERFAKEAERITGGLFGFPYIPRDEREERSPPVFSFPIKEEEKKVHERDGYEMQEQESLYSEFADKIRDV